jgi:hypothetical protein
MCARSKEKFNYGGMACKGGAREGGVSVLRKQEDKTRVMRSIMMNNKRHRTI